jgi:hypothetical protein
LGVLGEPARVADEQEHDQDDLDCREQPLHTDGRTVRQPEADGDVERQIDEKSDRWRPAWLAE